MSELAATGPQPPPIEFANHTAALAWLEVEWSNLVAAVTYAAEHGPRVSSWILADTLRGFFWTHRNPIDHRIIAEAALSAAQQEDDLCAQAAAEMSLADVLQCMGSYPAAIEHYSNAYELARQAGWQEAEPCILNNLGNSYGDTGDLDRAIDCQGRALELYQRAGDPRGQASALGNLGNFWGERGDLQRSSEFQVRALALYRRIDSRVGEANCLDTLGEVAHLHGRLAEARDHLTRAALLHQETGDHYGAAYNLRCLAAVEMDAGKRTEALDLASTALARASELGDPLSEAEAHNAVGLIHIQLNSPGEAEEHHRQALRLARTVGARQAEIRALLGLSAAYRQAGGRTSDPVPAEPAEQALALAGAAGYRILEGRAYTALAAARLTDSRHQEAAELARLALTTLRETGHLPGQVDALVTLGHALNALDGAEAAAACWQEALTVARDIDGTAGDDVRHLLAASE